MNSIRAVVTTLDTTGIVVLRSSATLDGVTGLNGLSVGSSAFSFLFRHVGLYIGNDQIVNAMNEDQGIGISSATYTNIVAVRRIY